MPGWPAGGRSATLYPFPPGASSGLDTHSAGPSFLSPLHPAPRLLMPPAITVSHTSLLLTKGLILQQGSMAKGHCSQDPRPHPVLGPRSLPGQRGSLLLAGSLSSVRFRCCPLRCWYCSSSSQKHGSRDQGTWWWWPSYHPLGTDSQYFCFSFPTLLTLD